jgi:hypothetical protein
MFYKKATKIDEIFTDNFMLCHKYEIVYLKYIEIHECLCRTDIAQTIPLLIFWFPYLPFLGFEKKYFISIQV